MKPLNHKFYKLDRNRILLKQGGRCANPDCMAYLTRKTATLDHVIPRVKVKYHSPANCVVLCERCNKRKAHHDTIELTRYEKAEQRMLNAIDRRIRQAEYRLSMDSKGSFTKWEAYHAKKGRWL